MARRTGITSRTGLAPITWLLLFAAAFAQETPEAPSFPSEASAITVDVVVLDDDGEPVRGLTRHDFVVREDGREQAIVGFETRDFDLSAATTGKPTATAISQVTVDNSSSTASPGRVFALLIDDLGISSPVASALKPALEAWIRERADLRDEITIMTTSGDVWWSDVVGRGRSDLLTVLDRFNGKRSGLAQRPPGRGEPARSEGPRPPGLCGHTRRGCRACR